MLSQRRISGFRSGCQLFKERNEKERKGKESKGTKKKGTKSKGKKKKGTKKKGKEKKAMYCRISDIPDIWWAAWHFPWVSVGKWLPKVAKLRYCWAFRISGPPPPRQAAGDSPRRSGVNFSTQNRDFFIARAAPKRAIQIKDVKKKCWLPGTAALQLPLSLLM